ncbi:MAG TPA: DUF402 domain-containing protein [Acidimicrobiia bacterium]|nr:DUF402 domain-containing protein [Acidimicrobiia bacterium]
MADRIHVEMTKWPDSPHWTFDANRLGEDQYGTWLHVPADTKVRRGPDGPFHFSSGFVGLVPATDWWVVEYYPDHPTLAIYVNVGTPPELDDGRLTQVDLDLDVIRRLDGTVEIIDVDEFDKHRVALGYPDELVDAARDAAERAKRMLQEGIEPFGDAPESWLGGWCLTAKPSCSETHRSWSERCVSG